MEKRVYKKTGEGVSLLGFGTMRLPRIDPDRQDIDFPAAQALIDRAYAQGVNYFDTAWIYHEGESEVFLGEALKKYPRNSFFLADKLPAFTGIVKNVDDAKNIFETQLSRCQTTYFDFYLCHSLSDPEVFREQYETSGVLGYLVGEQKAGRIRHLGFSFHGSPSQLEAILNKRDWDFAQLQLNYLDWNLQHARQQYELLEGRGVPCIVMEPVRGGTLHVLSEDAAAVLKNVRPDESAASWALRFSASLPGVLTVLSGMTALEHVEDNLKTFSSFEPLTPDDRKTLGEALDVFLKKGTIPCTGCRYCMDCPCGVDIPGVFAVFNECATAGNLPISLADESSEAFDRRAKAFLAAYEALPEGARADNCTSCGHCVKVNHCPQSIRIPGRMSDIRKMLGGILERV